MLYADETGAAACPCHNSCCLRLMRCRPQCGASFLCGSRAFASSPLFPLPRCRLSGDKKKGTKQTNKKDTFPSSSVSVLIRRTRTPLSAFPSRRCGSTAGVAPFPDAAGGLSVVRRRSLLALGKPHSSTSTLSPVLIALRRPGSFNCAAVFLAA